ncbi:hypothetical protein BO82DRAFT_191730 [Aspergillus uvarum CBS 121591]|uniref:Uncharacterized protein n=1 Tax=Aspergillus uvarum CBS 121591 TaxID=1448315 RepID=A0A319CEC2_9EURO|nr:hypothetical protein BO82DRAFT_191730 [Aspergillus uvarum CBS 121591]PYH76923.1 hypothetical protein BO82DRAFT_191730 [Aspergillus uvarum CBS 121591]
MSMPSACLLLQSTRCARYPRESRIAVPSGAPSAITSLSWPAAGTHIAVPNTDTLSLIDIETVPANGPITTRTHSRISLEHPAQTAATRLSQAPAAISTDTPPSPIATTPTTDSLSAFNTSYLPSVQHENILLSSQQTSSQTPSLSSSQVVQPSSTEHSEHLLGAASLITSAPQTSLAISTASTAIPTTTDVTSNNHTTSSDPVDFTHGSSSNTPLRTILGSVLGGLAFVALALVLGYYFMSSKRRTGRGSPSPSTSEEGFTAEKIPTVALPDGASRPGYQSHRSFLSDSSSVRSLPIHVARVPVSKPEYTYHGPHSSAIPRAANANPFVEPLELTYKSTSSRGTTVQSDRVMRNPFADPYPSPGIASSAASTSTHLRQSQMSQQQRPLSIAWGGSIYSGGDVSLGSTLILPNGRSSAGSSLLNRLSYPFTVNELSDAGGGQGYYDPGARVSTRSDPFDLEYPVKAAVMHRRSSTTIPLAQV